MRSLRAAYFLASLFSLTTALCAATELERYVPSIEDLRAAERPAPDARIYKASISPHWSADGNYLWYRNDLRDKCREYVLVDAAAGKRELAFDHERLTAALMAQGVADANAERLPIQSLWIDAPNRVIEFRAAGKYWRCRLDLYELTEIEPSDRSQADDGVPAWAPEDGPRATFRNGEATEVTFANRTDGAVDLFWLDPAGTRVGYGHVAPAAERTLSTYAGHVWAAVDPVGKTLAVFVAEDSPGVAEITGEPPRRREFELQNPHRNRARASQSRSPDGKWTAHMRDGNLHIANAETNEEIGIVGDIRPRQAIAEYEWSPDSNVIFVASTAPGDDDQVHLLESAPAGGGRARLRSRRYPLPGDVLPIHGLKFFSIAERGQWTPEVDPIDFDVPRPHWLRGGEAFAYEQVDRGHQRYRLIEINCRTGAARTLIDERSDTFIWTAHLDGEIPRPVTWLDSDDELIYSSERDGWRHLYLFDVKVGVVKNQITRGEWVVRAIDRIDEKNRQIWFRASGMNADQDPYFIHHYRVNFDGTGLTPLTSGNGTHRVTYSPDGRLLIDSYSRVDLPTVHNLRRADDGSLVCELERADASEINETGWRAPEPFVATGRDGKTTIHGIICRPPNFDANKRYPVIECIYAGPQGSFVPKSFSVQRHYADLTALGFIVVQIDGMGTANRSKAFHDFCWHNLKDAGFPDRILWHKAVAAKYPQYDLGRLGIYGGSAGGQNAAAAVLFHGDVYKAAVAGCGCHDNRMDKASWNEQWMGYPVGPQYAASSNIEHAAQLTGKLMLIVGELDDNVPPESTYRFADALIKAGKDFDLVVVPGAGHGMGGDYGERRLRDFFVRHLHGVESLDRNQP